MRLALVTFGILVSFATVAAAAQNCPADGNGDGSVTVDEIVQAVNHALNGCPDGAECNGDADCDGVVVVSEIILAVNRALSGCPLGLDLVVDVAWLRARLGGDVQVVDARVVAFTGGHIPGALPLSPYTLATTVESIPAQVVGAEAGSAALSEIGLRAGTTVVVYGVPPEYDPTRVVWALRYLGHPDVRYLDGGFQAWRAADAPTADGPPVAAGPSDYMVEAVRNEIRVTGDWVLEQLGEEPYDEVEIQIVDARSPGEYEAGRVPTALNVEWAENLAGGVLRPQAELQVYYAGLGLDPQRTTVVYCLAGWRASVAWLVLTYIGFEDVRVYDGSWLEWGEGGRFPIETSD